MRIRLALVLLALLAQIPTPAAWATPVTFYGATSFLSDWMVTGDAPVAFYPYEPGRLLALVGIVPYTRQIGAFPFTATWTLDDQAPVVQRTMMPEFDFGPLDDCRFGCPVVFGAIARFDLAAMITDWAPHRLGLDLTVPDDARHYDFDVQQPAPEPATVFLWGTTAAGFGLLRRARSRARRLLKP
jgi:hypothetical protein